MYQELSLTCRAMAWSLGPRLLKSSSVTWWRNSRPLLWVDANSGDGRLCWRRTDVISAGTGARGVETENPQKVSAPEKEDLTPAPAKVDVKPLARDEEIRTRLQSVLDATGWFTDPQVRVEEGVVFLKGQSETDELKKWAGDLAQTPKMLSPWPTGWKYPSRRYGILARRGAGSWSCGETSSARFPFSLLGSSSWHCR